MADNEQELYKKIMKMLDNENNLDMLAKKSYDCGKKNHHKPVLQKMVKSDLDNLIK